MTCDEVRRLGVTDATERRLRTFHERYRDPFSAVGLLVVEQVVRGGRGEAAGLEVGDVLTDLGRGAVPFPDFDGLEAFLDDRLGAQLTLAVERAGRRVDVDVPAGAECLHRLNPATFLEFGGGVLHALSLGAARNGNLDIRSGVYVAFAGFVLDTAGVPAHSVVVALGDEPTPDVEAGAGKGCEISNFKGASLGRFPLVSAVFRTSDHLSERSRSVHVFSGTRARGTPTLKRRRSNHPFLPRSRPSSARPRSSGTASASRCAFITLATSTTSRSPSSASTGAGSSAAQCGNQPRLWGGGHRT